jgi:DNA mismatch repair protein MSH5
MFLCLAYVLAVCSSLTSFASRSGRLGAAYYEPAKGIIHVLEDTQETLHFDLTRMRNVLANASLIYTLTPCTVLEQIQPDMVLTSTKSDEEFMDVLRDHGTRFAGRCMLPL